MRFVGRVGQRRAHGPYLGRVNRIQSRRWNLASSLKLWLLVMAAGGAGSLLTLSTEVEWLWAIPLAAAGIVIVQAISFMRVDVDEHELAGARRPVVNHCSALCSGRR